MKFKIFLLIILLYPIFNISVDLVANAEEYEPTAEEQLTENVDYTLSDIDLSQLDEIISELGKDEQAFFGTNSFFDKVNRIISGDLGQGFGSVLLQILNLLFGDIGKFVPIICIVVAIAILGSLVSSLKSDDGNISTIVNFTCFSLIVVLISSQCVGLLDSVQDCVNLIKQQMDAIFPILLTLLASVGGVVSAGIFQTTTALLANLVLQLFTIFVMPLFLISFVFSVLGNLVDSVKLSKFNELIETTLKWTIGIIFGVFSTVLTIQGIVAGSYDGMSINAAKFALKSYVPILGGYLSDGFNYVAASGILIKNSVGFAGLILLLASILPIFVRIVVFGLLLKLGAAVTEPIGMNKISSFLSQNSKLMFYLVGILLVVGFMYVLTLGLMMSVANVY